MDDISLKYRVAGNLKMTITGKLIYTLLYDLSDDSRKVQISVAKISSILKISETAVRNNLHRLEAKGYILIKAVFEDDGTRKANEYIVK